MRPRSKVGRQESMSFRLPDRNRCNQAVPLRAARCAPKTENGASQKAIGIPANCVFQQRAQPLQKQLKQRYRRTQLPQRGFSSFRHRARDGRLRSAARRTAAELSLGGSLCWRFGR